MQRIYERMAQRYDRFVAVADKLLFRGGRHWAASRAQGRVLEIAVGDGRNLALFPPGVQLTGVELRRPEVAVRAAGLVVEEMHRSVMGIVLRLTARKP